MISLRALREQPLGATLSALVATHVSESRPSPIFVACSVMMLGSLLLGGGTRPGFLSDVLLQLLAIPALIVALSSLMASWRSDRARTWTRARWALLLCMVIAILPLVQLVPLPPWIWQRLPGRQAVNEVFDLLGAARPWMPISVSPNATWLGFLSLLPPMAVFLGVIQLGYRERRALSVALIAFGVVSAFLGLLQVAQGPSSALRFFSFTNTTEAVGFFANRNHLAALLYAILLFAFAWSIDIAFKVKLGKQESGFEPGMIVALTASFMVPVVLIAAEATARSRAGLILMMVAVVGGFALVLAGQRGQTPDAAGKAGPGRFLAGAVALAVLLVVQFALYRILDRFGVDPLEDARIGFARDTIQAASAFMPFGSGIGTFVPVYGMFEEPRYLLIGTYANHAHNDFLELWLEAGIPGMMILLGFGAWLVSRSITVWRTLLRGAHRLDVLLVRSATIGIVLIVAHSCVDYPLRTGAIMAVFAMACALLVEPLSGAEAQAQRSGAGTERMLRRQRTQADSLPLAARSEFAKRGAAVAAKPVPQAGGRWGEDIDWPQEWSKSKGQSSAAAEGDSPPGGIASNGEKPRSSRRNDSQP